ncbi:MAG: polymer-forming cytoskeletal protein [Rhodospirillales bacterium]|nr:polymer-forming cytoskeletal protein [Rhodospirillales bacterium]
MFSKNSKDVRSTTSQVPGKPQSPSIISAGLSVVGDLSSNGEIQVDGNVDGDIQTKTLLVGESANIKGSISCDTIRVHGSINGQIKSHTVFLAKTAHVVGDVLHETLSIETGAFIEGHCKRMAEQRKEGVEGRINLVTKGVQPAPATDPKKVVSGTV